ncbi:MAG TPA: MDR family MFS transporter [Candidatus Dormibacteraeota bacterium]|nr:MDR family MFS transporter [Candidatus Dormibacteraeota bacterium]
MARVALEIVISEQTPTRVPWTPVLVRVMAGLMISLFVAAMDSTVVGTALPTIARELGSFQLYPWIIAGYLITGTTTVPLWGRLADLRGRKPVLIAGLAIFVIASALCAASPGMGWLIAFRTLQGIGAGCIQPLVFTTVSDIFPLPQRARLQGFFSSMWAVAAIVGPALGALFVSTIGWRWIFTINIPIGIIATALLLGYSERKQPVAGRLEVRGSILLTVAVTALLIGLGTGSQSATPIWPVAIAALAMLALFLWLEWRSPSPIVPLRLLRNRTIGPAILIATIAGTLMFGVTAYLPLWVQSVEGGSPYQAGVAVAAMSFGWPIASAIAGLVMVRVGYQRLVVFGAVALMIGSVMLAAAQPNGGFLWASAASAVIGIGMGSFAAPLLIVVQSSVGWAQRGAATALNQFSRTIGGAVGVALMGIVVQRYVGSARAPLEAHEQLALGLHADFVGLVGLASGVLIAGVAVLLVSRRQPVATRASEVASAGS